MPIQFEQVTGEIAPERAAGSDAQAAAPASEDDLHEKLFGELALLHERRARLFAD
jgi:hypothetical protein